MNVMVKMLLLLLSLLSILFLLILHFWCFYCSFFGNNPNVRHDLMVLWFTDLMNVTKDVTIHRLNISTLLSSAFIRGELYYIIQMLLTISHRHNSLTYKVPSYPHVVGSMGCVPWLATQFGSKGQSSLYMYSIPIKDPLLLQILSPLTCAQIYTSQPCIFL